MVVESGVTTVVSGMAVVAPGVTMVVPPTTLVEAGVMTVVPPTTIETERSATAKGTATPIAATSMNMLVIAPIRSRRDVRKRSCARWVIRLNTVPHLPPAVCSAYNGDPKTVGLRVQTREVHR
jgi:hypothetical protein